jgi:hypothetical protein|tara:strand:+ start:771 stop:2612 length:1842 start_codon:yes stop_codon:yes gene_type:complete
MSKEKWQEIADRGLQDNFDPETRARFDEAVKRGIITLSDDRPVQIKSPDPEPINYASGIADLAGAGAYSGLQQGMEGLSMLGGLRGIGTNSMPQSIENAQAMTAAMPEYNLGDNGRRVMGALSDAYEEYMPDKAKPWAEAAMTLGESSGDWVLDKTGSPLAATATRMIPDTMAAVLGGGAARSGGALLPDGIPDKAILNATDLTNQPAGGGVLSKVMSDIPKTPAIVQQTLSPKKASIRGRLEAGTSPASEANLMLDGFGKVVKDPMSAYFDDEFLHVIKSLGPEDKKKVLEMTQLKEHGIEFPLMEGDGRPSNVAGASLMERIDIIREVNEFSGRQIDIEARNLKGQPVDFSQPVSEFLEALESKGATYNKETRSLNFTEKSIIGRNPAAKALLNEIVDYMSVDEAIDASGVHDLKRFIDDQVAYGKSSQQGSSATADKIIKKLRAGVDSVLDNKFPAYDKANTDYSKTIKALTNIKDISGKADLEADSAGNAAGILMRRIMSNATSGTNLRDSMSNLDSLANEYGGGFKDSLSTQSYYANKLDRDFGASAKTSFQGQNEAGILATAVDGVSVAGQLDPTFFMTTQALKRLKKNKKITTKEKFAKIYELLGR